MIISDYMKTLAAIFLASLLAASSASGLELKTTGGAAKKKASTDDLLRSHLELVSFRHKVLSENVANLNTPGYKANEVAIPSSVEALAAGNNAGHKKIALKTTSKRHMLGRNSSNGRFVSHKLKDPLEIKQNGNNVSLSQQINKISQNQADYNTGLKVSASNNSLISTVLGK